MAWDDEYSVPAEWSETEERLFDDLIGADSRIGDDQFLQGLFDEALFHDIHGHGGPEHDFLMDQLAQYLLDEYDIVFDEVFDWEGWRDWYDS